MFKNLDETVGLQYLKAVHVNDSKGKKSTATCFLSQCNTLPFSSLSLFFLNIDLVCLYLLSGACGCHLDRHENIGKGKLTLAAFQRLMNDPRLDNLPMILETPNSDYEREINLLYGMIENTQETVMIHGRIEDS